jgi:hypothetical protein
MAVTMKNTVVWNVNLSGLVHCHHASHVPLKQPISLMKPLSVSPYKQ